jgi:tripartite-type tricarboxylate transporter receptor subunit TctC
VAGRRLLLAAPALLLSGAGRAQGPFPDRPIRILVPYAPGGQSDSVARLLGPKMAEALGQPLVFENRTGAGGSIAAGIVAAAPPDGHTLLIESFAFVVLPLISRHLTVDYETAFAPVGQAVSLPYVLAVKRDFPAGPDGRPSLASVLATARDGRGCTYGTPGVGTPGHLAGALLASRAGVRLDHVPYRGGAEAARDLAAGTLDAAIITANSVRPLIEDGRAHGVALTSAAHLGTLAALPTIAESGFPGFDLTSWNGYFAPAATPAPVLARLEAALRFATEDAATRHRLAMTGNDAISGSAADFAALIRRDREVVRRIVREAGIRPE